MSKKGFTLIELLAVISILALIAIVVFPAVNSMIKSSKEKAYRDQIAIVENAAKEWALDNVQSLPETVGGQTSVPVSTLVGDGYISEDEVIDPRDNSPLNGNIVITYESNQYTYRYDNDTVAMAGSWLKENALDKANLKANNGVYKGQNANNYLSFKGKTFRILSVNSNGTIKAVMSNAITTLPFDSNGNSNFTKSTIYTYLNNTFLNTIDASKVVKTAYCTGNINSPCGNTVVSTAGLLSINDYVNASNKPGCNAKNNLCKEGTYLNLSNVCLMNEMDGQIYVVNNGVITLQSPANACNIMPVITLSSNAKLSGNGSAGNPFVVN